MINYVIIKITGFISSSLKITPIKSHVMSEGINDIIIPWTFLTWGKTVSNIFILSDKRGEDVQKSWYFQH